MSDAERYEARRGKVGIRPKSNLSGIVHATYGVIERTSTPATTLCGRDLRLEPLHALAENDRPCRRCFPLRGAVSVSQDHR